MLIYLKEPSFSTSIRIHCAHCSGLPLAELQRTILNGVLLIAEVRHCVNVLHGLL